MAFLEKKTSKKSLLHVLLPCLAKRVIYVERPECSKTYAAEKNPYFGHITRKGKQGRGKQCVSEKTDNFFAKNPISQEPRGPTTP